MKIAKYVCFHKPTKCWVHFRTDKKGVPIICLSLKDGATEFDSKNELKDNLKRGTFNSFPKYGSDNFLEFKILNLV